MKVAVYAIALNEQAFVERFMATAREADVVIVADTGSTDETAAKLTEAGAIVHAISIRPWRFDDARNAVLALVPADVDVCVAIDLDEVLTAGWRERLEAEWGDANRGKYSYAWSHHADGSPAVTYTYDRIHSRHGYRWRHPCHETLYPDRINQRDAQLSLELHHWPDPDKQRSQYLGLLAVAAQEQPHDSRTAHYYGRELMFSGQWAHAVDELRRHLELPASVWAPERAASMRFIGRCLAHLGQPDDALVWFRAATDTAPATREPWVELAQACHEQQRWHECYDAAAAALHITERPAIYINEASAWGELPDDLASVAAWHMGLHVDALAHAVRAAELAPDDRRIAANLAFYRNAVQ
ncbi:MAG TPA: hypothetical protein PK020_16605 [Ilumatobacteraceae bacterium]|nr:hypothetical protein [Ilumatobacteraceae bacterium]HRB03369.1 hypothetical protein [Ilumatobacteraceae bacterium]